MKKIYDDLLGGLEEAIEYEKGSLRARKTDLSIAPVKHYSNSGIKNIRNKAGMTQSIFAKYMGVSQKTVEAWENGRRKPTGPACRLLEILEEGYEADLCFVKKNKHV